MKRFFGINQQPSLADLLNYAHFVDDGIILNKDGAFVQTFEFRGPDMHSATSAELDALIQHFNRLLTVLDDGWMLHLDTIRIPSLTYPPPGAFPHPIATLIDEERRQHYEAAGQHYENRQFLTLVWKFPLQLLKLSAALNQFKDTIERMTGLIRSELILNKLSNAELLAFLNTCLTGELLAVSPPPDGCYLDVVLGRKALTGGYIPKIDEQHIYAISITGYLNETTAPGLLEEISAYPLVYRWSNRFIALGEATAEREMKRYQKNWNNKIKGLSGILQEAISGRASNKTNVDAAQMSQEITAALTANSNHSIRFGYWTSAVILIHRDIDLLNQAKKFLREYLERNGFSCHVEDINALETWLGSIPGHGSCNARRLFIHSLNFAHVMPLHSLWAGAAAQSAPVFYAATTGKTPFRFHLDVEGVGHQIILGPTGAGKSTYLDFLICQFLRYPQAQIFVFDKDFSHRALTLALGGYHYNLGVADTAAFCPLADLSNEQAKMRAVQFIETLAFLQNGPLTPRMRNAIHTAIKILADPIHQNTRNLTVLCAQIQDMTVREALQYYTIDGPMKLLDHTEDSLQIGYLQTFEMSWLLAQKPEVYLPVLFYIFDQIDSRLVPTAHGLRPTLIVLEEAWLYISHPLFAAKLKDWLKTLRKKNARVIFATQSLADLYDPSAKTLTAVTAAILESCPTKIFLPNPHIDGEIKTLYEKLGLNTRQIEIITQLAIAKQHYYVVTPQGKRLIDLGLTEMRSVALAFIGLSLVNSEKLIAHRQQYGSEWIYYWLKNQGFNEWAEYWRTLCAA